MLQTQYLCQALKISLKPAVSYELDRTRIQASNLFGCISMVTNMETRLIASLHKRPVFCKMCLLLAPCTQVKSFLEIFFKQSTEHTIC